MDIIRGIWSGIRSILIPDKFATWKVIILCIIGATTFWFFNALNKSYTTTINYPVTLQYDESRFIAVADLPDKIEINITGGGWNLLRRTNWFNITPINLVLDDPLQSRISGNSFRGAISDQLDEFQLNFIVTDSLRLQIENRISRPLRLAIDSSLVSLEEGHYMVSPIRLNVDSAIFTGPESMVTLMNDPFLINLPDQNIDSDFQETISIETGFDDLFSITPAALEVSFEVRRFQRVSETVNAQLVNFPSDSSWYVLDPFVTVSFLIREDQPSIDSGSFEIILDLSRMAKADSTIQPLISRFPVDVLEISIDSERVKVFHE